METTFKVLIIEDHPMMVDGYKEILKSISDILIDVIVANSCSEAYQIITTATNPFDVVLLDINLPSFEEKKIYTGEDLAILIRKSWEDCKIIILTSHTESILLFNVLKRVNPEGLLIKSDFTSEELLKMFKKIFEGNIHLTFTAKQSLKNIYIDNTYLDSYNRRIVSLLAKGVSTKSMPDLLNITLSAIDKRKAYIKELFEIRKGTDEDIIREARSRGLI